MKLFFLWSAIFSFFSVLATMRRVFSSVSLVRYLALLATMRCSSAVAAKRLRPRLMHYRQEPCGLATSILRLSFPNIMPFGFAQKIWLIFALFVRIIILFVFVQSYHPIGSQFLIKLPRYSLFCDQCEPCGYHPLGYQSSNDKSGSDIPSPLNQSAVVQHQLGQNVHVQHQVPPRDTVVPAGVGSQQFQQPWLTIRTRAVLAAWLMSPWPPTPDVLETLWIYSSVVIMIPRMRPFFSSWWSLLRSDGGFFGLPRWRNTQCIAPKFVVPMDS